MVWDGLCFCGKKKKKRKERGGKKKSSDLCGPKSEGCTEIMVDYSGQTSLCQDCSCSNRSRQILSDVLGPSPWKCLLWRQTMEWHTPTALPLLEDTSAVCFQYDLGSLYWQLEPVVIGRMYFRKVLFVSATASGSFCVVVLSGQF